MKTKNRPEKKNPNDAILAIAAAAIFCLAMLSVALAKEQYLKSWATDLLAMPIALFPWFYLFIGAYALLASRASQCSEGVKVAYLIALALLLWIPPFMLTDFALRNGIGRVGDAMAFDRILAGENMTYEFYPRAFPVFFASGYFVMKVMGVQPEFFANFVFPVFTSAIFVASAYVFLRSTTSQKAAFIGVMLLILMMHFLEKQPSPRMTAFTILFAAMALIVQKNWIAHWAGALLGVVLAFAHPTLPFFFLIMSPVFAWREILKHTSFVAILLMGLLWLGSHYWFYAERAAGIVGLAGGVVEKLGGIAKHAVMQTGVNDTEHGGGIGKLVESVIAPTKSALLHVGVYALLALTALYAMARVMTTGRIKEYHVTFSVLFVVSAAYFAVLPVVTGAQENSKIGLIFMLLSVSAVIGSAAAEPHILKRYGKLLWLAVIAAALAYPYLGYYEMSFMDTPRLEAVGLEWLVGNVLAGNSDVFIPYQHEISFFMGDKQVEKVWSTYRNIKFSPSSMKERQVMVWREKASHYYETHTAFSSNVFDEYFDSLENSTRYDKTYSSSVFKVMCKPSQQP